MKIILWLLSPHLPLLNHTLKTIERERGSIEFVGAIIPHQNEGAISINNQLIPILEPRNIQSNEYDLIIVCGGKNISVGDILNNAKRLGLDADKILFDSTSAIAGFTLERYQKLRRSQLSVISMGNLGDILSRRFLLSQPAINIDASDRDFLNFIRDPLRHINSDIRSNTNWFNLLVVMCTRDPNVAAAFDRLPYAKKVCFVPFQTAIDSAWYIPPHLSRNRPFEQVIQNVADGLICYFDLWDMLLYGKKTVAKYTVPPLVATFTNIYSSADGKVHLYNSWHMASNNLENWAPYKFIKSIELDDKEFNFFSVFGDHNWVRTAPFKRKIFYTAEDVFVNTNYPGYQDYCLSAVDLALGYEYLNAPNYIRYPSGLMVLFQLALDRNAIENRIAEINSARNNKKFDCVLINSHDRWNTRTPIYNLLKNTLDIKCAGRWNRNTDELQTIYNNDKIRYVHEFMFNICPENVNRFGYVTEKIFDAFRAGSIPIYYGSDNRPEPGIINPDAVLFFDPKSDNQALVKEVQRLKSDDAYYDKFIRQEKLFPKPTAEFVYSTLEKLAQKLRDMQ